MKITLGMVKAAVANISGLCESDTRVVDYVNRGIERLMAEGNWVGTIVPMRIQAQDGQITWPREIETIISYAICNTPGQIRNSWYEFLEGGPGQLSTSHGPSDQLVDRGQAVAFNDVTAQSKLMVLPAQAEPATNYIILRFLNQNGEPVRTQDGAEWIDGELFSLSSPHTTANICNPGGLLEVVKTQTLGTIRLFAQNISTGVLTPLAYYAPDEEVPVYRRSLVPGLKDGNPNAVINVMAKRRFIPARKDNDVLMIQSAEAIRLAVQGVLKEERDLLSESTSYWTMAVRILQKQLENYLGAGVSIPIRMVNPECFGAGFIGEYH